MFTLQNFFRQSPMTPNPQTGFGGQQLTHQMSPGFGGQGVNPYLMNPDIQSTNQMSPGFGGQNTIGMSPPPSVINTQTMPQYANLFGTQQPTTQISPGFAPGYNGYGVSPEFGRDLLPVSPDIVQQQGNQISPGFAPGYGGYGVSPEFGRQLLPVAPDINQNYPMQGLVPQMAPAIGAVPPDQNGIRPPSFSDIQRLIGSQQMAPRMMPTPVQPRPVRLPPPVRLTEEQKRMARPVTGGKLGKGLLG